MMYLARCVREMWASKYGTLDSALKISQTPGYLPLPGHRSPKITIADVCPPSARIVFGGGEGTGVSGKCPITGCVWTCASVADTAR